MPGASSLSSVVGFGEGVAVDGDTDADGVADRDAVGVRPAGGGATPGPPPAGRRVLVGDGDGSTDSVATGTPGTITASLRDPAPCSA